MHDNLITRRAAGKTLNRLALAALLALSSGCSTVYRLQTDSTLRFTENRLMPPLLANRDTDMACSAGISLSPLIRAMGESSGADYDQLATLLDSTSALCSDDDALNSELRSLRATRANRIEEAQDALIEQQRWSEVSARRQYQAYQHFAHYTLVKGGVAIGDGCPKFARDFDEMVYLLGLVTGLEAVINDVNAKSVVGVPTDIAAKTERAMSCLNNDKWFGVPQATQAAIWNMLPGAGEGHDPWATMQQSLTIGEHHGVRLAHALYAMAAYTKADEPRLRDALRRLAATQQDTDFKVNPAYAMFDQIGVLIAIGLSDRYWSEHVGTRTPAGGLGTFWDEQSTTQGVEVKDLL